MASEIKNREASGDLSIAGETIPLGESRDIELPISQTLSGRHLTLPLRVIRAPKPGPTVLIIAAIHGDEINGTGVVRRLLTTPLDLIAGNVVLVPVANLLGFERLSRYMPDRRDLNRCFPGSTKGSLSSRFAHHLFNDIVRHCDACIDFHTAAIRRTNFPNVRADLTDPDAKALALEFGSELTVSGEGPKGSLRRTATLSGIPTIILEAGETWKTEPTVVEVGLRGIHNVLIARGMLEGSRIPPRYQALVHQTQWLRSDAGGLLTFHVGPGDIIEAGAAVATVAGLFGKTRGIVHAPHAGIVLGQTTLPAVEPGDPVCHLAAPEPDIETIRKAIGSLPEDTLYHRLREDLGSSIEVR